MAESTADIQPAAHEDAKADTRSAAKWLIAAFAAVGAVLLSGVGLANLGHLDGLRLLLAILAFVLGTAGVIVAVYLIAAVLTPAPVTLTDLARYEEKRNDGAGKKWEKELVAYVEADPTFLQGIVKSDSAPMTRLIDANKHYQDALDKRFEAAETYWKIASDPEADADAVKRAKTRAVTAGNRASTMHGTVRRLEKIGSAQQALFAFKARRGRLALATIAVTFGICGFAIASNPPAPATADFHGANLEHIDLSGASLREANLEGMTIRGANLEGTNLEGAKIEKTVWKNTICPDGTNSDNAGGSCAGHLEPDFKPDPLP